MIPVNRKRWFELYFSGHVRRRFAKRFSAVRVRNLATLADASAKGPVLIAANHTCWWDALVIFDLSFRTLRLRGNVMMDARNLRAIPMLGWIGAFGVELGDKADGQAAVKYATTLLAGAGDMVGVFPQGRERPVTERPLAFKSGIARIAMAKPEVPIVPIALRYEHGKHEKPEALVSIGALVSTPKSDDEDLVTRTIEDAVTGELDALQRSIHAGDTRAWPVHIDGGVGPTLAKRLLGQRETV